MHGVISSGDPNVKLKIDHFVFFSHLQVPTVICHCVNLRIAGASLRFVVYECFDKALFANI